MIGRLFSSEEISRDLGLLIVRVGVGLSVAVFHGYGKITGGVDRWVSLGGSVENLNISFIPAFWGFMAGFAEFVGSCLVVLGILFRPMTFLLAFTMFVAVLNHLNRPEGEPGAGWSAASHALELLCVYLCLMFSGPGKFSLTLRGRS